MEVVDKNVESNNKMLDYLKSIDVNSINTHEEFELDDFIASVVMINTNYTTLKGANTDYIIYLIFQDKQTNKLYGKFFTKEFSNKDEGNNYYQELIAKAKSLTSNEITSMIQ